MQPTDADRDHASYRNLLGAYALGAVSPEERRTVAAHLSRCPACRAELARLRSAVDALPLAIEDREPPPTLRDGIEAAVRRDLAGGQPEGAERRPLVLRPRARRAPTPAPPPGSRPDRRSVTPWAAVAALLLAFSLGMLGWNLRLQQTLGQEDEAAVALRPARPTLLGGGGRLGSPEDREPMVVTVRGLPPRAPDLVYELWPVRNDAVPATPSDPGRSDAAVAEGAEPSLGTAADAVGLPN